MLLEGDRNYFRQNNPRERYWFPRKQSASGCLYTLDLKLLGLILATFIAV
jgi:hypothetical protein